jgi:polyphosphate:AMP phosphotransferase
MLTDEGVLIVKLWFHLTKKQQKKRLESLEADKRTRWRVGQHEWTLFKSYDKFSKVSEHFVRSTSTGVAPWYVINGADPRYRSLTVGTTLLAAMRDRLDEKKPSTPGGNPPPLLPSVDGRNVIRSLKLDQPLSEKKYEKQLEKQQGRLNLLSRDPRFRKLSVVAVFEGNDAAGKGGAVRRVFQAIDARFIGSVPVAAPTEEERAQPYLWRFWRHLPRKGHFLIYDRSWYGRVLVERVEGFADEPAWMRAYQEINDFELDLVNSGVVLAKFWLAISKEEQFRRFKEREKTIYKKFKITEEDWRNRKKWDQYERAVCDMVDRTSTDEAPWTLVEANNKYFARVKVLETLADAVEKGLDRVER